jgi:hypothetical protein
LAPGATCQPSARILPPAARSRELNMLRM